MLGDLDEKFERVCRERSLRRARWNYWYQVMHYLRPFAMGISLPRFMQIHMVRHYFTSSWRNLLKRKLYSGLNIAGLTAGLTCFLLLFLYVQHEQSFDRFYPKAEEIYRIIQQQPGNFYMGTDYFAVMPAPLAQAMQESFPEVGEITTLIDRPGLVSWEEQHSDEEGFFVDSAFFTLFDAPLLAGDPQTVFQHKDAAVLTVSLAERLFGEVDPVGKTIRFRSDQEFMVRGIIADPPANSSFQYSYLFNILANKDYNRQRWDNNSYFVFFTWKGGQDPLTLGPEISDLVGSHKPDEDQLFRGKFIVEPLTMMHYQVNTNFDLGKKGSLTYIFLFSGVGIIILILACINYMNLAVARSINRGKEVGIRKVVGAKRRQLMVQFLGESTLVALIALVLAVWLTSLLSPYFGRLVDRPLEWDTAILAQWWPLLILLVVLVGLLSGSYPAMYMSAIHPSEVFKGKGGKVRRMQIQKGLIIGQFVVSMVLVCVSLIIYTQVNFMQERELGYEQDHILAVELRDFSLYSNYSTIYQDWMKFPHIQAVARSRDLPTKVNSSTLIDVERAENPIEDFPIYHTIADEHFLDIYNIEILAGRNFSPDFANEGASAYILNETAARAMGWTPEEAIGKQFIHNEEETVIGVVKDFHMHSLHMEIKPLMISYQPRWARYFSVKVQPEKVEETLAFLEENLKTYTPYPLSYMFVDEHYDRLYKQEKSTGESFRFFTLTVLIIAALGLFGLAAFTAEQRVKEIGIRKVLGASVFSLCKLMAGDYVKMVAWSCLIAFPTAYFIGQEWLKEFAYRIEIPWWIFGLTCLGILSLTLLSVSFQALKVARANPVESLRAD